MVLKQKKNIKENTKIKDIYKSNIDKNTKNQLKKNKTFNYDKIKNKENKIKDNTNNNKIIKKIYFPPKKITKISKDNLKKSYSILSENGIKGTKNKNTSSIKSKNKLRIFEKKNNDKFNQDISKDKFLTKKDKNKNYNANLINNLNDEELNNLDYEQSIIMDKRTYFQYYLSLLKKKHLILFAFSKVKDYNLVVAKISLFLLSFSLYFNINGFFFSDETMKKINNEFGRYNIYNQIPQILLSFIISSVINLILKLLSLSEKSIILLKKEKGLKSAEKKSFNLKKNIKIKLTIFYIIGFLLMSFFWYYISCFCAAYKNTQLILIKDTLVSFGISMIYPFGLNLLPGIFRISAIRAPKKDKKCLYKFSQLVSYI